MSRTVTALYDTKAEAEAALERLGREVNVDGRPRIIDQSSSGDAEDDHQSDFNEVPLSSEDRATCREGLRRGGFMLCAEVDEDEDRDKIVSILETSGVDLDDRQTSWRAEGWDSQANLSAQAAVPGDGQVDLARGKVVQEQRIPLVEEQLRVGKREVNRGGARVRSYVEERPVEENVTLREEHVNVERRPVNQALSSADVDNDDLLRERTVEMRATAEALVVDKEARVNEEVVIQKTATEHTEQVRDTVRNTKADVDDAAVDGESDGSSRGGRF